MTTSHVARLRKLSRPRISGSVASGTATSNVVPTSAPKKSRGMTLMTATGPFGPPPRRSSSAVNVRPNIGATPSPSKYSPLAQSPSIMSV